MSLLAELQALMHEYRFRPNQRLSQNFIVDEALLEKMVSAAELKKTDSVAEIGCGTGFLTRRLLGHCKVIGFEKDAKMAEILSAKFSDEKGFTLVQGDFLSVDFPEFTKVVSLPPYGISTDLIVRLFLLEPEKAVLVLQREFVEKLAAEPGFWDYGYVSVLTSLRFDVRVAERSISPGSFYPSPNSFSSLVVLSAKRPRPKIPDPQNFVFFVRTLFRYQNKNLANALRNSMPDLEAKMKINRKAAEAVADSDAGDEKVKLIEPEAFADIFTKISR